MPVLFLSHSSVDNAMAAQLRAELKRAGYDALFLDFDERDGLTPGARWRDELSQRLRTSDAVVFLGTENSKASIWCAAEIGMAKVLEKAVLPVQMRQGATHDLLSEDQWITFRGSLEATIERLISEVDRFSSSRARKRSWDASRPPYPGLRTFTTDDAGVFFGRDAAIDDLVRLVNPVAALDHRSIVAVVGPSGVGKSSLLYGGLLPLLLDRATADPPWLVVPPLAPATSAMAELARRLVEAGLPAPDADAVRQGWRSLTDAVARLQQVRRAPAWSRVLIAVDQADELARCADWARALQLLLDAAQAGGACRVVLTAREGHLTEVFRGVDSEAGVISLPLRSLARAGLAEAIEGPALRAGLTLEPGFATHIVGQVADADALPFTAAALHRTWSRAVANGSSRLTIDAFEESGGLRRAIVEQITESIAHLGPDGTRRCVDFLTTLAGVDERGDWIRVPRPLASLTADELEVQRSLEAARLLVTEQQPPNVVVTVAHVSLFTAWPPLTARLEERSDDLVLGQRIARQARDWMADGRPAHALPTADSLRRVLTWRERMPDYAVEADTDAFVHAARDHERHLASRRRRFVAAAVAVALIGAGLAVAQVRARAAAGSAERVADGRRLLNDALHEPRFGQALALLDRAAAKDSSHDVSLGYLNLVLRDPAFRGYLGPAATVASRVSIWTPSGGVLAADAVGNVRRWNPDGTEASTSRTPSGALVRTAAIAPDDSWHAVGDIDGRVWVWARDAPGPSRLDWPGTSDPSAIWALLAPDTDHLIAVREDGRVARWTVSSRRADWTTPIPAALRTAQFAPGGAALLVAGDDGFVGALDGNGQLVASGRMGTASIRSIALVEGTLVGLTDDGLWTADASTLGNPVQRRVASAVGDPVPTVLAAAGDGTVLAAGNDGVVRQLRLDGIEVRRYAAHRGAVRAVSVDSGGRVLTTADDGLVARWQLRGAAPVLRAIELDPDLDLVGSARGNDGVFVSGSTNTLMEVSDSWPEARVVTPLPGPANAVAAHRGTDIVAVALVDGRVLLVDRRSGDVEQDIDVGAAPGRPTTVANDGYTVVAAGKTAMTVDLTTGTARVLPIDAGAELQEVTVARVGGSSLIVVSGSDPATNTTSLLTWTDPEAAPVVTPISDRTVGVGALAVAPDGRRVAVGLSDTRVLVVSVDDDGVRSTDIAFAGHEHEIEGVVWASPVVVASVDRGDMLELWDPDTGVALAPAVDTALSGARDLAIAGDRLVVMGTGGIVAVELDPREVRNVACALAGMPCGGQRKSAHILSTSGR